MDEIGGAGAVKGLETLRRAAGGAHAEFAEAVHRHRRTRTFENARSLRRQRNGAEGSLRQIALVARSFYGEIPVEPAVGSSLIVGRSRLHVVLRIEVRACRARTADRMHRSEYLLVVQWLERCEGGMESEESVEVNCSARA